jgi:hypothetical protein
MQGSAFGGGREGPGERRAMQGERALGRPILDGPTGETAEPIGVIPGGYEAG